MRHLIGIVLAVVMAVAVFCAGWGLIRFSALTRQGMSLTSPHAMAALGALLGAGLLLGILIAAPRISPLATGLPGLVLLGWTALLVVSARHALGWIPLQGSAFGAGFREMLASGILAFAGLAMIFPLFVPSRWWGSRDLDDEAEEEGQLPGLPARTGLLS